MHNEYMIIAYLEFLSKSTLTKRKLKRTGNKFHPTYICILTTISTTLKRTPSPSGFKSTPHKYTTLVIYSCANEI